VTNSLALITFEGRFSNHNSSKEVTLYSATFGASIVSEIESSNLAIVLAGSSSVICSNCVILRVKYSPS
jgi:hypothetical protein